MCDVLIFSPTRITISFSVIIYLLCYTTKTCQGSTNVGKRSRSVFEEQCESNDPKEKLCKLPPYPRYGSYMVVNRPRARPRDVFEDVSLIRFIADENNELSEVTHHTCSSGVWSHKLLSDYNACSPLYFDEDTKTENEAMDVPLEHEAGKRYESALQTPDFQGDDCHLDAHGSVRYWCGDRTHDCDSDIAHGDTVTPECAHWHYSVEPLPPTICHDGHWNYVATCLPECGTNGDDYVKTLAPGIEVKISELPWHVGIYSKDSTPYSQICGGSIIATGLLLTAAHCFWSDVEKLKSPSRFAVIAGQLERSWDHDGTNLRQRSDVADIKVPPRFRGSQTSFQDDIAMVFLVTPLVYNPYVLPVCLDFDLEFDRKQLTPGNFGQVAGWGLTSENGKESPVLLYENLPYVDIERCINNAPPKFIKFITSDKICAGNTNGTALCRGDSGGGLVFRGRRDSSEKGDRLRHYLRGIASTAPADDNLCNLHAVTGFTHLLQHEHFIGDNYNGTY